jgi:hypothetical protein
MDQIRMEVLDRIPERHVFAHRLTSYLCKCLEAIRDQGEALHAFDIEIPVTPEDEECLKTLSNKEIYLWLLQNGYQEQIYDRALRQLFLALLTDFCTFISQALECSEKARMTVAFALIRKPLKDNLLLLEWLLADSKDLLERFHGNDSEAYAPDRVVPARKLELITKARKNVKFSRGVLSPEFLYDVRYRKTAEYSLERYWNQAAHLVTTFSSYKTEGMHLNMVFGYDSDTVWLWDCFYVAVPSLLFHAVDVVESLYYRIIHQDHRFVLDRKDQQIDIFRRQLGFILLANQRSELPLLGLDEIQRGITRYVEITCDHCGAQIPLDTTNLEEGMLALRLECRQCSNYEDIQSFVYGELLDLQELGAGESDPYKE